MTRYRINPGEFRHIITIQKKSGTPNDYGEEIKDPQNWIDITTARAAIYPVSVKEFFSGEKMNSEVTHKVHIRFLPNINPDMRIQFGQRNFKIESVINFQEKNILLQIMCKELM